jgi:hypothetical protein
VKRGAALLDAGGAAKMRPCREGRAAGGGRGAAKSRRKKERQMEYLVARDGTPGFSLNFAGSAGRGDGDASALLHRVAASPAFYLAVDGLTPAHCLCCYGTENKQVARAVDAQLATVAKSVGAAVAAETPGGAERAWEEMGRDMTLPEVAAARAHAKACAEVPDAAAQPEIGRARRLTLALGKFDGVAAAYSACEECVGSLGVSLWVYSTPEARKLARRLAKRVERAGFRLTARGAPPMPAARFMRRRQVFELHRHEGAPDVGGAPPARGATAAAWDALDSAVRALSAGRAARAKGTAPSKTGRAHVGAAAKSPRGVA